MKILRLRRRRRRRRRKRGQTLADVGVRAKQNANGGGANGAGGGKKKKTFANGALPHRIQDRVNDGDDAASSSEDKEFADRASSRTRDSMEDEEEEEDAPTVRGDSIENDSPREQRNKETAQVWSQPSSSSSLKLTRPRVERPLTTTVHR